MAQFESLLDDEEVVREITAWIDSGRELPQGETWGVKSDAAKRAIAREGADAWTEAVLLGYGRPVLRVQNGKLQPPLSPELRRRMRAALPVIERRLRAVGRVVVANHPRRKTAGTAWLSSSNHAITTAAVAADVKGREASIEFPDARVRIEDVVLVDEGADIAVLRVEDAVELPQPIPIALDGSGDVLVAAYLTPESEAVSLTDAARRVAGASVAGLYAAPGKLNGASHDATIAGDATGGVILDAATGAAVGMHSGISAKSIRAKAKKYVTASHARAGVTEAGEGVAVEEAVLTPADYLDRKGFDPKFLGDTPKLRVRLPESRGNDALEFKFNGKKTTELKYEHFSVVMSKSRQLCLFSAVNIDGKSFKKAKRQGWLRDPRIEDDQQIFGDVYGNSPRFSRGHMTRREDPIWGVAGEADKGNRDSMHFTNAAPQMQPFNAPVWLALEDYALQNARKDKMRISVMTGPFFRKNDPVKFGVRIPVEFWKIILFIHDDTGELTCTGYTMSQEEFLSPLEFVFGEFKEAQVPVSLIEKRAKLNFHGLARHDPLAGEESAYVPLTHVSDVRFV